MARKTANAGISMPTAMLAQLDEAARKRGVTRSVFVQQLFTGWLQTAGTRPGAKRLSVDSGCTYITAAQYWCLPQAYQIWPAVLASMDANALARARQDLFQGASPQDLLAQYLQVAPQDLIVTFI